MRKFTLPLLSVLVLSLAAGTAQADVYSYQLSNAPFTNGTTLSGTWSFDTGKDQVTAMNLTESNFNLAFTNTGPIAATATPGASNSWQVLVQSSTAVPNYPGQFPGLNFGFNAATGAPILYTGDLNNVTLSNATTLNCCNNNGAVVVSALSGTGTYAVTGIQPVPEPASAALMLSGLGMVLAVARRRRPVDRETAPVA